MIVIYKRQLGCDCDYELETIETFFIFLNYFLSRVSNN